MNYCADGVDYRDITGTPNRLATIEEGDPRATTVALSGALAAEQDGDAEIFNNPDWDLGLPMLVDRRFLEELE